MQARCVSDVENATRRLITRLLYLFLLHHARTTTTMINVQKTKGLKATSKNAKAFSPVGTRTRTHGHGTALPRPSVLSVVLFGGGGEKLIFCITGPLRTGKQLVLSNGSGTRLSDRIIV